MLATLDDPFTRFLEPTKCASCPWLRVGRRRNTQGADSGAFEGTRVTLVCDCALRRYEALMGGTAGSITGVGLEVGFEDSGKGVSQLVRV
jgi:hypothetical protein